MSDLNTLLHYTSEVNKAIEEGQALRVPDLWSFVAERVGISRNDAKRLGYMKMYSRPVHIRRDFLARMARKMEVADMEEIEKRILAEPPDGP